MVLNYNFMNSVTYALEAVIDSVKSFFATKIFSKIISCLTLFKSAATDQLKKK